MLADPTDQHKLIKLAELDAEVARRQHTAKTLPQHQQIQDLMSERQTVADSLVERNTAVSDLEAAQERADADLAPVRERLKRDQQRIDEGSISDAKTLRSLTEEVEHLKRRITDLETAQLDVMGSLEQARQQRDEVAQRKSAIETEVRQLVASRDEQASALAAEAKDFHTQRTAIAAEVPQELVALYDKLRASTGAGAAKLYRGRCTGCQLEIPISDLDDYRKAPANQVLRCVECNRILVRTPESGL